jgi:hypothetical protein
VDHEFCCLATAFLIPSEAVSFRLTPHFGQDMLVGSFPASTGDDAESVSPGELSSCAARVSLAPQGRGGLNDVREST